MCDYSLHAVASRPAKVGETLVTTSFYGTSTRGFAAKEEPGVAVCLLPGTELAFPSPLSGANRTSVVARLRRPTLLPTSGFQPSQRRTWRIPDQARAQACPRLAQLECKSALTCGH